MKRYLLPIAIAFTASLIALLVFEVFLRVLGFSAPIWYRPDDQLGWTLRPGISAWQTAEGRALVETNAAGWRDSEHALAKPADVYRIAVLGDSYAEAMQVAQHETFWAQLPERLVECDFAPGKRIEVLNFGVSGYGTAQEYLMLEQHAMQYQPDLVLLQFTNGNDVRNNSPALEEDNLRPFYRLDSANKLWLDDSFAATPPYVSRAAPMREVLREITDASRVMQLVHSVRLEPHIPQANAAANGAEQGLEPQVLAPPQDKQWEEAWQITEQLLLRTHALAHRHGAGFMVATVPYAIQVHPDPLVRAALQSKLGVADLFYPDTRIAEFARRNGIAAVPLAPRMQRIAEESKAYFHGFPNLGMGRGHWNADGHRVAAELIAQQLCKNPR